MSSSLHSRRLVIRASAGSGKTHALTNRLIDLLLNGVPPDAVLATTFTRKAAGEIFDRVLLRLAEAANGEDRAAELARQVAPTPFSRAIARDLLIRLVRHLHRMRIATLDSFFARVATSFALELRLPVGWSIVDEVQQGQLIRDAVQSLLNEDLHALRTLMQLLTKGEATRSVTEQIRELVLQLHELYQETLPEAWQRIEVPPKLRPEALEPAIAVLEAFDGPDTSRMVKTVRQDCQLARSENWPALLESGIVKKVVAGESTYDRKPLPDDLVAAYRQLLAHARAVEVDRLARQTAATHDLLARFDGHLERLLHRRRLLRFHDVTRTLAEFAQFGPRLEELMHRLDGEVRHLLLDEFQDTSLLQWRALLPLVADLAGRPTGETTFFCVGDVKQAIYGWRGGVAEIFDGLHQQFPGMDVQSLNTTWRSSPIIIRAVNRVFESLASNAALEDKHRPAAQAWQAGFQPHETHRSELPGHCRLVVCPAVEGRRPAEEMRLDFAADEIQRLAAAAPAASVGVLVRKNRTVAALISALKLRGVPASEEGGNPLTDSPAVEVLLAALWLADHPQDRVAAYLVACSPLAELLGLEGRLEPAAMHQAAARIRRWLLDDGYGPTLFRWARVLAASCGRRDTARLEQLVALAHPYDLDATLRPSHFVHQVQQQRVADPQSAQVRVMTIHQAKGLEFDMVVLPELEWHVVGQPPEVVTHRAELAGPVTTVCRYVKQEVQDLLDPPLKQTFEATLRATVRESLCLLYVALTRAIHALYIIVQPRHAKKQSKTYSATPAGVLCAALAPQQAVEPEAVLYENGDPAWFRAAGKHRAVRPKEAPRDEADGRPRLAHSDRQHRRNLPWETPSSLEGGRRVDLRNVLRTAENTAALEHGSAVHAVFARIHWLEDAFSAADLVREVLGDDSPQQADVLHTLLAALESEALRELLSEPAYRRALGLDPRHRLEVWRERPFAVADGDGLLAGQFDRVVVAWDGSQPLRAEVIDFKTDRVAADDEKELSLLARHYQPQLAAYRRAVAQLVRLPTKKVTARLALVRTGQVVPV